MASNFSSVLVCVLLVVVVPVVWANYCNSYTDSYGVYHNAQQCGQAYCCGDCNRRTCCTDYRYELSQKYCHDSQNTDKKSRLSVLIGSIVGTLFPVLICVGVIICCVAPCCLCYKKCRKGNQRQTVVLTPNVINTPDQPLNPSGYNPNQPSYPNQPPFPSQPHFPSQPPFPGYQPVPGYGPGAPPPAYMGNNAPSHIPVAFSQGQPMYPLQPPGQTHAEPPQPEELEQPAYNPDYVKES